MRIVFFLAPILHITAKITLFDEYHPEITSPTFGFFENRSNEYNVTGIACHMSLVRDPDTELCKAMAPPNLIPNGFTEKHHRTIMYLNFDEAKECGITTISQLFGRFEEVRLFLKGAGYPPSSTLVVFMNTTYEGVVGCPMHEPYIATGITIPDSLPSRNLNVALVGKEYTGMFAEALNGKTPFALNIEHEVDPWNAVFLSFGYIIFTWGSTGIQFISVIIALKLALSAYERRMIVMDLRNMIFWMAVPVAILYSVALPMRYQTYVRRHLELIGNLLCGIAFHVLLYLWSLFYMKIRPSYSIYLLWVAVLISVLTLITNSIFNLLIYNQIYGVAFIDTLNEVFSYIGMPTQGLMALFFIVFGNRSADIIITGVKSYLRKSTAMASPKTIAIFARLSFLGFFGFVGYTMLAISNLPYFYLNVCQPTAMLLMVVIKELSVLLRTIALLFILGAKSSEARPSFSKSSRKSVQKVSFL